MGFAFLESYWYEENRGLKPCTRCKGKRGAIYVQYSLNVNQPQILKEAICPSCDRLWCEKTYPPILWKKTTESVITPKKAAKKKRKA